MCHAVDCSHTEDFFVKPTIIYESISGKSIRKFNIVIPRNPKAIKAVVLRLNDLLHLDLDLSDLDQESEELEVKLNFMASHNQEFQAYIEELEKEYVEVKYEAPLDITANEAVQLAEEFLKETREE